MQINLMTYNLRYDNPKDGSNSWENRKKNVATLIQNYQVDILCVQECMQSQKDYLEQNFSQFSLVGVGRNDGWLEGEMVNIFYNHTRFEKQANGDFWLSETPEVIGSSSWGSALPRLASWIKLYDKQVGKSFFVFNTHFDHKSLEARRESALLLHKKVKEIAGNALALITGDFNLTPAESTYSTLAYEWIDLRKALPTPPKQTTTFNGFGTTGIEGLWIDYIFANTPHLLKINAYKVIDEKIQNIFPSDHFPILLHWELVV